MVPRGDTALWDALVLADERLSEYGQRFPEAKKRVICLSDGEDNKSSSIDHETCWKLAVCSLSCVVIRYCSVLTYEQSNNVVVDSFCIGDVNNTILRTISHM